MKREVVELSQEVPSPPPSTTSTGLMPVTCIEALPLATMNAAESSAQRQPLLELDERDTGSLLGSGAFGRTYVGWLHSVDGQETEKVAVKLPKETVEDNFYDEAIKLASIRLPSGVPHPYLIRLLAYVPERRAIVMELCEGDLEWYRRRGPGETLGVAGQVELMEQASGGCAWVAKKNFVHRDLKMQNILIARSTVNAIGHL
eukprot:2818741-Amphidinium_carterae.1